MRIAALAAAATAALMSLALAGPAAASIKTPTNIAPQELGSALRVLAADRHLQILYRTDTVANLHSGGAVGEFTVDEALNQLLGGTDLVFRYIDDNTITIMPRSEATSFSFHSEGRGVEGEASKPAAQESRSIWSRLRLAQSASSSQAEDRGEDSKTKSGLTKGEDEREARSLKRAELEEIVVTGSRLKRSEAEISAGVQLYGREMIERSGQTTLSDFLNTLPAVSTGTPENGPVFAGQTSVQLRGLPLGTTLVLLNGRRVESGSATFGYGAYFDLNNIPAAAVERVEIVPEGSSAIYGSDAMAGVVNIVLKNETDGVHVGGHYGAASGINESGGDFAWGTKNDKGSLALLGSYFTRGELSSNEREITSSTAYGSLVDYCNPGNVYSTNGGNLPGLSAPSAAVNPGVHDAPGLADFTAAVTNRCRRIYSTLIPPTDRFSALASGSYRFDAGIELFSELMYSQQRQDTTIAPKNLQMVMVPSTNAYNPFGTDVRVSYVFNSPHADIAYRNDAHFSRALIGARGNLARSWGWELAAWDVRDKATIDEGATIVNAANLAASLASSNPATALNLFTSGPAGSDALISSIYGVDVLNASSSSQVVSGFLRGPTLALPDGAIDVVLGGEFSRSGIELHTLSGSYNMSPPKRNVSSLFSEIRVPLLHALTLGGAVRYDHYDSFGGHLTPQYSIEWRPAATVLVRGAYAKAFKAPILFSLNYPLYAFAGVCCVTDPTRGGQSVSYTFMRQGDPSLRPESAESKSIALTWLPSGLPGFESSLSWWRIDQHDRVAVLDPQTIVNNESLFGGRVVRDPQSGTIQSVNVGFLNFGELRVSGSDLSLRHRVGTRLGYFSPSLSVTRVYKYEAIAAPGAPVQNRLGVANDDAWAPRWKGMVGLGWERGSYTANVSGRYVSSYRDYPGAATSTHSLGDFWLWDLSFKYQLDGLLASYDSRLRGAFVQLSAVNVFNSLPIYSSTNGGTKGYDSSQYDIRGRFIAVNVGARF